MADDVVDVVDVVGVSFAVLSFSFRFVRLDGAHDVKAGKGSECRKLSK